MRAILTCAVHHLTEFPSRLLLLPVGVNEFDLLFLLILLVVELFWFDLDGGAMGAGAGNE